MFAMDVLYSHLRRFGSTPLWIAAVAIVLTVIFGDLPGEGLYVAVLQNGCHSPAFAVLSLITLVLLTPRIRSPLGRAASTVATMVLVGAATEGIQSLFGRDAELEDVVNDLAGSLAVTGFWLYLQWLRDGRARIGRGIVLLVCVGAVAYWLNPFVQCALAYWHRHAEFPVLAQFHSQRDLDFISSSGSDTRIVPATPAGDGGPPEPALQAVLDSGPWPGITVSEPAPDWHGYHTLALELGNPGTRELPLRFRINDRAHKGDVDDRFNMDLTLPPGIRETVRIPVDRIAGSPRTRRMDMSRISQLTLFRDGGAPDQVVRLYRIWLE
jgi:hypothetical protein